MLKAYWQIIAKQTQTNQLNSDRHLMADELVKELAYKSTFEVMGKH